MIRFVVIGLLMLVGAIRGMAQIRDTGQVVTIPVVVHVVYNTSEQNISDAQIQSQLDVLNKDYRKLNTDSISTPPEFLGVAADCGIEFQLANFDTAGNATSGITRTQTNTTQFANDNITSATIGGKDSWGTNYLNIWVSNLPDGVAGWTNNNTADSTKQGVILDFEFFGTIGTAKSPYHLGRTATHEIGHWLGLKHLEASGCNTDDGIEDTPNQEAALTGNITSNVSCGSNDMTSNFMQLVNDEVMNIFTQGQKSVMRESLFQNYQSLLLNIPNTVGLENEIEIISQVTVFPNPVSSPHFTINKPIPFNATCKLQTLNGLKLNHTINRLSTTEFELPYGINSGMYLFTCQLYNTYYQTKLNISY